jgi:phosphate/sulfate permease
MSFSVIVVAVVLAGVLNLVGAFLSVQVAKTISSGLVNETKITPVVIFGGLVGAILWNLIRPILVMMMASLSGFMTWVLAHEPATLPHGNPCARSLT